MARQRKQRTSTFSTCGYTLVEAAIVVTILAIIGVGGLQLIANKKDKENTATTTARMEEIEVALQTYATKYGYLPCPADPRLSSSDANFAKATAYDGTTHTCHNSDLVYNTGLVPVRTLQLADAYLNDGWGSRFTYRISTNAGSSVDFKENNLFNGSIQVTDLDGKSITLNATETFHDNGAAYILISYGRNNRNNQAFFSGVWDVSTVSPNPNSITSISPGAKGEKANADHNRARYVQNKKLGVFDDIVFFQRRSDLFTLKRHEGIVGIPNDFCNMAKTILRGAQDANLNSTGAGADVQLAANRIFDSCLGQPECRGYGGPPQQIGSTENIAGGQAAWGFATTQFPDGKVLVTYTLSATGVVFRIFNPDMSTEITAGPQSITTEYAYNIRHVAMLDNNRWVITYTDSNTSPIHARIYNYDTPEGAVFTVADPGVAQVPEPIALKDPITGNNNGKFAVFYARSNKEIYGTIYDQTGAPITPANNGGTPGTHEFLVSPTLHYSTSFNGAAIGLNDGNIMVLYTSASPYHLHGFILSPTGGLLSSKDLYTIPSAAGTVNVTHDGSHILVAMATGLTDLSGSGVSNIMLMKLDSSMNTVIPATAFTGQDIYLASAGLQSVTKLPGTDLILYHWMRHNDGGGIYDRDVYGRFFSEASNKFTLLSDPPIEFSDHVASTPHDFMGVMPYGSNQFITVWPNTNSFSLKRWNPPKPCAQNF